jgi:hypothetical protein
MDRPGSWQRVVTSLNILFALIAAGILVGVFKFLLIIVALWFMGASRLLSVSIAVIGYFVIFAVSFFICRRAKSADLVSGTTVAWALSPTVGLIGIAVSATYLFGACSFNPFYCGAPISQRVASPTREITHYTASQPTPADTEQSRQAQAVADDNQRRTLAVNQCASGEMNAWNGQNPSVSQQQRMPKLLAIVKECRARFPPLVSAQTDAPLQAQPDPGLPVKTFGGSKEEISRNRIIDIHECTNKLLNAWFKNGESDHSPDRQRQKTNYFSNACAAWIDGTGPMPGAPTVDSSPPGDNKATQAVNTTATHPRVYRCAGPGGTTVFTDTPCLTDSATADDQAHH